MIASSLSACSGTEAPPPPPADPCAAYAFHETGSLRVFAIQPRLSPAQFETYASYRGYLQGLVDARVVPCRKSGRTTLLAFPEDIGLSATFIGSRGKEARAASSALAAFLTLPGAYGSAAAYYTKSWPGLSGLEGVFLSTTDTAYRAFSETMAGIATATGAYVVASTNVSGTVSKSTDPADIAALRDPDLTDVPYVYVAKDRAVYNTAFVFDPTGAIVGRARKPYLVDSEEEVLHLGSGALAALAPITAGSAKLGILTSKDAWMPDMVDRLDALGANVFVQPEAFSGWTIEEQPGDWLPDVFQQSAWAATQKHSGYRYAVVPHLTGNLFDQVFDGQSAVIGDAVPGETGPSYVGQDPQGGFLDLAPWVIPDPGLANASLSLAARREELRAEGQQLLPGHAHAGQYVEAAVAADIDPAAPFAIEPAGPPGALGASTAMADVSTGEQRRPALAVGSAGDIVAAFQDDRGGWPQIYVARGAFGGAAFKAAIPVAASSNVQLAPAVLVTATSVYVAWQERDGAGGRILAARSGDGGATFGSLVVVNASASSPDEWGAALATDGSGVYLAFVASAKGNERVVVARAADGTLAFQMAPAGGDMMMFPPGHRRNNQWAPAIAAKSGEIDVAWVDFRNSNWDVFLARSSDAGKTFGDAARIDDGTNAPERLHDDPALAFAPDGVLLAGWSDVRLRGARATARAARAAGSSFGASQLLNSGPAGASAWRPRFFAAGASAVVAVWQDFQSLGNDIYLAKSADGGASFSPPLRIDDGGEGPSYQFSPTVAAAADGKVIVAWEDTRSGRRQVRYAIGSP